MGIIFLNKNWRDCFAGRSGCQGKFDWNWKNHDRMDFWEFEFLGTGTLFLNSVKIALLRDQRIYCFISYYFVLCIELLMTLK